MALLLGAASGAILVPLNSTMLAVALPRVMAEFGLGAASVATLVSLYLGTVAIAMPVAGAVGDRWGHRRTFLLGVIGFGAASALAMIVTSFVLLQLARVLQAIAGALISTSAAAIVRDAAPAGRRGEAFGFFDLLVSTSAVAGPFLGGLLVGAFGWRSMFAVAIPVAILAAASVGFVMTRSHTASAPTAGHQHRLDLRGLGLLGLAIGLLLAALRGGELGIAALAATVAIPAVLAVFVLVELRTQHPAVDLRLFGQPAFAAAIAGIFGATVVLHGTFVIVPLFVERLLGASPAVSGLVLLGIGGASAVVAPFGGRASDRLGRRRLVVAGSLVMGGGLVALAVPGVPSSILAVGALLAVVGLGMGLAGSARQAAALEASDPGRIGMAAGTYYTGRYLGGVVGASLAGAVLGGFVTFSGVSTGFAILAVAAVLVAVISLGLPGRLRPRY